MSSRLIRRAAHSSLLAAAALAAAPFASAAIVTTASSVYDEQANQLNAVDATATTPIAGNVTLVTLANFKTEITNAAAAGSGGVINFDDVTTPVSGQNQIVANFGNNNSLTLTGNSYQVDMTALAAIGATPISGGVYLRNGDAGGTQSFAFSAPLSSVGVTALARGVARSITATVTYDNGTTGAIGPVAIPANTGSGATSGPDTFFGFDAPAGRTITSLTLSAGANNFFVVDDIGFVAAPEPGTLGVAAIVGIGGLIRRRRR